MASVVLGPLVQGISGELGGVVFHGGGRAGVVSRAACRVRSCTDRQRAQRDVVAWLVGYWYKLPERERILWGKYAAQHLFRNRLAIGRRLNGMQCFLAYGLRWRWDLVGGWPHWPALSGAQTQMPVLKSWEPTISGEFIVNLANENIGGEFGYLFVERHLYVRADSTGHAVSVGRGAGWDGSGFCGFYYPDPGIADWRFQLAAKYPDLQVGEWIRCSTYWTRPFEWPSGTASFVTQLVA